MLGMTRISESALSMPNQSHSKTPKVPRLYRLCLNIHQVVFHQQAGSRTSPKGLVDGWIFPVLKYDSSSGFRSFS